MWLGFMLGAADVRLELRGYAAPSEVGEDLGLARARAAQAYLVGKGVAAERIQIRSEERAQTQMTGVPADLQRVDAVFGRTGGPIHGH
jgi:outer membrane protein OmpA-like peptidoglycan-associated protein